MGLNGDGKTATIEDRFSGLKKGHEAHIRFDGANQQKTWLQKVTIVDIDRKEAKVSVDYFGIPLNETVPLFALQDPRLDETNIQTVIWDFKTGIVEDMD